MWNCRSVHVTSGRVITMLTVVLDYCLLATSPTYRADRSSPHPKLLIGYNGTPTQKVRRGGGIGYERDKETRRRQNINEDREKTRVIQRNK